MASQTKLSNKKEIIAEQQGQSALEIIRSLTPVAIDKSVTDTNLETLNAKTLQVIFSDIRQTSGSAFQRVDAVINSINSLVNRTKGESASDTLKLVSVQKVLFDIFNQYTQGSQGILTEYLMSFLLNAKHVGDETDKEDIKVDHINLQLKTLKKRTTGGTKFRISGEFDQQEGTFTYPPTVIIQEGDNKIIFYSFLGDRKKM